MFSLYILKDRKSVPVDEPEWAQWFGAHHDERVVGRWDVAGTEVSTVFLGFDHQFRDGPPLLFETMVFGPHGTPPLVKRYSTWAEAEDGHMNTCTVEKARVRTPG
jgi:hypothetical protein